jgi:predicted nuclease of predicted toxin-antitoxin system
VRVLLDENVPRTLARSLAPEHEARTVKQQGWAGRKNGELLESAAREFDALLTTDRGIPHQQNFDRHDIGIVLLQARSNRIEDLEPLIPEVKQVLVSLRPGILVRVTA